MPPNQRQHQLVSGKYLHALVAMLGRGTRGLCSLTQDLGQSILLIRGVCLRMREGEEKGEYTMNATVGFVAGTCAFSLGI